MYKTVEHTRSRTGRATTGRIRKRMKTRSLVTLLVTLLLIVLVGALAVNGLTVGKYIVKPVGSAIKLGLDLRGGIYAVYKGDSSVEDFETLRNATVTIMINRLTAQGYTEATVTPQGSDRIRIEIPDVEDPNEILSIVGTPAPDVRGSRRQHHPRGQEHRKGLSGL